MQYTDPSLLASSAIVTAAQQTYDRWNDNKWHDNRWRSRDGATGPRKRHGNATGPRKSMKNHHKGASLVQNYVLMQKVLLSQSEILRTLTNLTSRLVPKSSTNIDTKKKKPEKARPTPVGPARVAEPEPEVDEPEPEVDEPGPPSYGQASYGQAGGRTRVKKRKVNCGSRRKKRMQRR